MAVRLSGACARLRIRHQREPEKLHHPREPEIVPEKLAHLRPIPALLITPLALEDICPALLLTGGIWRLMGKSLSTGGTVVKKELAETSEVTCKKEAPSSTLKRWMPLTPMRRGGRSACAPADDQQLPPAAARGQSMPP